MYDTDLLLEKLTVLLQALERIPRRFIGIATPVDFYSSDAGIDRMDANGYIIVLHSFLDITGLGESKTKVVKTFGIIS